MIKILPVSGAGFAMSLGLQVAVGGFSVWSTGGMSLTGGQYASLSGSPISWCSIKINNPITGVSGNVTGFAAYSFNAPNY